MVDNAVEFDVVTIDSEQRTINVYNGPDLFWAMCGGGGGTFAVLTAYRFQLHPAKAIDLYTLCVEFLPLRIEEVLHDFLTIYASKQTVWSENQVAGHAYYFPNKMEMYLILTAEDEAVLRNLTYNYKAFSANHSGFNILENQYSSFEKYSGLLQVTQSMDRLTPSGFYEVLAGRLLPRSQFSSHNSVSLVNAVMEGNKTSDNIIAQAANIPTQVIMTTPVNHPNRTATGLNPAWRDVLWHLVYSGCWTDGIPATE